MTRRVPWTPLLLLLAVVRGASESVRLQPQRVFDFASGSQNVQVRPEHLVQVQVLQLRLPSELVSEDVQVLDARLHGLPDAPVYAAWIDFEQFMDLVDKNGSSVSRQWLLDGVSVRIKPKFVQPSLLLMLRHWMLAHPPWQRAAEPLVAVIAFERRQQVVGPLSLQLDYQLDGESLLYL